ncbi:MAG TPA: DNA repair protein RadA [Syntrophorhabdaceae bacterium]|jgi:DNA repair protein RadA/Sms
MAKKTAFMCDECGYETSKWLGRCPRCGNWETVKEFRAESGSIEAPEKPVLVREEDFIEERVVLGIEEMDRVLGGGLTRGSSILLGGDPGIGKTTLCFEIASKMVELGHGVLYVSGEESLRQLSSRRRRLMLSHPFPMLTTSSMEDILTAIEEASYGLVIIDSIQSIYNPRLPMLPGSPSQIKDVSSRLIREMKRKETAHVFIGHVTKEGAIAGPKILEHMVDTVLYFEGDKTLPYRMLRAIKNRYGSVDEVGIFQMQKEGLISVENASQFFVAERGEIGPGSTLFPYISGSRPLILEVQAITPKTNFAMPKRLSLGYDMNRLYILIAVIEKVLGKTLFDRDIYVNVTSGMKVTETAIDLAVAAAILSSFLDRSLGKDTALVGEVGLTGEVRRVAGIEARVKECERLGITKIFCPRSMEKMDGMDIVTLKNLKEFYEHITGK